MTTSYGAAPSCPPGLAIPAALRYDRISRISEETIHVHRRIKPCCFSVIPGVPPAKKAQKWLDEQGIAYTQRDIKEDNPTLQELETWHQASALPLKKFFNTSGQLYRALSLSKKLPDMTQAEQYALLASDGMLVKRPILVLDDGRVLVGFQQDQWAEALG